MDQPTSRTSLIRFVRDEALPCWAAGGVCAKHGGSFEQLSCTGEPYAEMPRRVRVQARQIYAYSHAHYLGWVDGRETVDNVLAYMQREALGDTRKGERAGCAHTVHPDGSVIDARRDLYDQAFLLLAMGWAWRAFGLEDCKQYIDQTWHLISTEMAAENGGWIEAVDADIISPRRRQNPHMHLFEAFMELSECLGDPVWLDRAAHIRELFELHFYDRETGGVIEFFDRNWRPEKAVSARVVEPGHVAEWSWLLHRYGQLTGQDESALCSALLKRSAELGMNPQTGLLYDTVSSFGRGGKSHRTWPQTEYIRALAGEAARGGDVQADLDAAEAALMKQFVRDLPEGLWVDQLDGKGAVAFERSPASTFYHILGAAIAMAQIEQTV